MTLQSNLDCSASAALTAIDAVASNVTIDFNGYTITDDGGLERGVTVTGEDGVTIKNGTIDACGTATFIWVDDSHNTTIQDMVFKNATTDNNQGVVWIQDSNNSTVTRCTFQDNVENIGLHLLGNSDIATFTYNTFTGSSYYSGGSLFISGNEVINDGAGERVTIAYNTFTDEANTGDVQGDGHMIGLGGGVLAVRTIKRVDIYNNTITGSGAKSRGGLIAIYNTEDVNIYNNYIYNNNALEAIGVGTNCKDTDIYNNLITGNSANVNTTDLRRGVIWLLQATGGCGDCDDLENTNIYNNTLANNDDTTSPTEERGAIGIRCSGDAGAHADFTLSGVNIEKNIFYNNLTSIDAQNHSIFTWHYAGCAVTAIDLDYNDWYIDANTDNFILWNETDDDGDGTTDNTYTFAQFAAYQAAESQDASSLASDPLLLDPTAGTAAGLKLGLSSPCIDAGTNTVGLTNMNVDFFGLSRVMDGDNDGTVTIDIGAHEFFNVSPIPPHVGGKDKMDSYGYFVPLI